MSGPSELSNVSFPNRLHVDGHIPFMGKASLRYYDSVGLKTKPSRGRRPNNLSGNPSHFFNLVSYRSHPRKRRKPLSCQYANELQVSLGNMCERSDYTLYRPGSVVATAVLYLQRRHIPAVRGDHFR